MYEYTDPVTGKNPVTIALRSEDARMIGLRGYDIGDVVWAVGNPHGISHGKMLPADSFEWGDLRGLLIMDGPGLKENYELERTVSLIDIVPTLYYLLEIPVPRDAEGGVMYQALEDPDLKMNDLKRLRRNYERVMKAMKSQTDLTHTY